MDSERRIRVRQYEKAMKLDEEAAVLIASGLAKGYQEATDILVARQKHIDKERRSLTKLERAKDEHSGKTYYFRPEDELRGEKYYVFLRDRDVRILNKARERLKDRKFLSRKKYLEALEQEIYDIKYYSVMVVSAPHLGGKVSGDFPGEPTPAQYALSVVDWYVRSDTFPAEHSPEIISFYNPSVFSDEFIAQFTKEVKEKQPRVVCVSNTSEGHFFAIQIAQIIRQYSPNTLIILGGSHEDGLNPQAYLRPKVAQKFKLTQADHIKIAKEATLAKESERDLFDVVVAGDGQYALVELLKMVGNSKAQDRKEIIRQIIDSKEIFRSLEGSGNVFAIHPDSQVIETASLSGTPLDWNALPFMFRGRLTSENRFPIFNGKKTVQIMCKMGCKYACDFCMESMSGTLYKIGKPREIPSVLREIEIQIVDYKNEAVFFDDSTFTQSPHATGELVQGIIDLQKKGVLFEWGCQTTFTDIPSKELLAKMKQAGCSYIYFGFEQLEEKITGLGAKVLDTRKVEQVLGWCKEIGIRVGLSLQFGLQGIGKYRDTIDYISQLREKELIADNAVAININTPYPGTAEWVELLKRGSVPDFGKGSNRHPRFETALALSSLTVDQVNEIYAYARKELGKALIGVKFDYPEIEQFLRNCENTFASDFYFNEEHLIEYINGGRGLHLNSASLSVESRGNQRRLQEWQELGKTEQLEVIEKTRQEAAELVGVSPEGVIMTRNTTEAAALISKMIGLEEGDRVLMTTAENPSIKRVFEVNMDHGNPDGTDRWCAYPTNYQARGKRYRETLAELTGVKTDVIGVVEKSLEEVYRNLEKNLTPETKCFVMSHVIRDTGVELPVKEIIAFVRRKKKELNPNDPNIFVIVDGAQALGNLPRVDYKDLGCDAYLGTPSKTMGGTVGLGFFDPGNPMIQGFAKRLNKLHAQDEQVILRGMFDDSLGIKANVDDEIDSRDVFHFLRSLEEMKELGYESGDFSKIAEIRGKLKTHFQSIIKNIVRTYGLKLDEVQDSTNFIHSFSVRGIDNRRFVEELDKQGIFISYIDRAKIQAVDTHRQGNGVIRASFSYWNTREQMDSYHKKIEQALANVIDAEVKEFEEGVNVVKLGRGEEVLATVGRAWEAVRSPVRRIAVAASVILGLAYGHRLVEPYLYGDIPIDPSFIMYSQSSYLRHQESWEQVKERMDTDGIESIPWTVLDRAYVEKYYAEKYSLLMRLSDGEYVTRELRDKLESYSYYEYTDEERHQIILASRRSENPYLLKFAQKIAKPEDLIWQQEDTAHV